MALIITYMTITVSITIWLSVPAFERVPLAIEEAARVDRLGPYATFFRITLPVAKLQVLSAIAFSFILIWNEFLLAMMLTSSLPVFALHNSGHVVNMVPAFAASHQPPKRNFRNTFILSRDGKMIGIVGEVGGFLDVGDKHVAIAVNDVSLMAVDDQEYAYVTRLNEEDLEELPGVDEGFWN
ncbi:hypothetical protein P775_22620 [Puniceibacterium antarcticum]|uniref:ABC transmembrane type-1 domain-containing protein n=1 Tax=Puniceibacterium antarcticum TaxID=1206336 RepID=A0A2G8R8V2_9RHOB|nr:ABC transporter permease subunit [Puniceibacterium antarcticum]PIL17871.1 hypothetical protein P775_22620 [Puniceibacterium antarcticum]